MLDSIKNLTIGQVLGFLVGNATSIGAALGIFWYVGTPMAEDFIQKEVKKTVILDQFATKNQLDAIDRKTLNLEKAVEALKVQNQELLRQQSVFSNDLDNSNELAKETRDDVKLLLRSIRRLER